MIKKIAGLILILYFTTTQCFAMGLFSPVNHVVKKVDMDKDSVFAMSVKRLSDGKTVYEKNQKKYLNTASSLKLLTFAPILKTLGNDYKFETAVYADKSNNIYIKLGADPLLSGGDLVILANKIKKNFNTKKIKYVYVDDTIMDTVPYPDGWTWDDFWPNLPKLSPYTVDGNQVKIDIYLPSQGDDLKIIQSDKYKFSIINQLEKGLANNISVKKEYGPQTDIINLQGTINKDTFLLLPVNNPKYFFITRLSEAFNDARIPYSKPFYFKNVPPKGARKIASFSHDIKDVAQSALKFSNNLSAETAFKVAGGKYAQEHGIRLAPKAKSYGTTKNAIAMFYDYYKNAGLDVDNINVVDGSGVSRYNALSAEWMCDALLYIIKDTDIKNYMAQPTEGTLSKRLRSLKGRLWAKTGTLFGTSSLSGYLDAKNGNSYAFVIIIQNYNKKTSLIKSFEDDLVNALFKL